MTRLGVVINLETCKDQRGCMVACKREHNSFLGSHYVETFTAMDESFPRPNTYFIPILCQHCAHPSCVSACENEVFAKREDGIVTVGDTDACETCASKACVKACPYHAIDLDPLTGKIGKCDLCASRIDAGEAPACMLDCCSNSWFVGDLDDPESIVSQIVRDWGEHAHQLKPETGNAPSVYYLLHTSEWRDMDNLYSPAWHNDQK